MDRKSNRSDDADANQKAAEDNVKWRADKALTVSAVALVYALLPLFLHIFPYVLLHYNMFV